MRCVAVALAIVALVLTGCPAVYPELGTRTRTVVQGQALDPPPPSDLKWIKFLSARVPARTRDGRLWQSNGKASPYVKLYANDVLVVKTESQPDTLEPTWPNGPRGNFRIQPTDRVRVELWDSNALNDKPIGLREMGVASDLRAPDGQLQVDFEEGAASGAYVTLAFEPAHAVSGLGLWYELRSTDCAITRTLAESPAERAGLVAGDSVVLLGDKPIEGQTADDVRSAFNAVPLGGLKLTLRRADGTTTQVTLKEGPIYATFGQFGPID